MDSERELKCLAAVWALRAFSPRQDSQTLSCMATYWFEHKVSFKPGLRKGLVGF